MHLSVNGQLLGKCGCCFCLAILVASAAHFNRGSEQWVTEDRSAQSVVDYGISPRKYTASETGYHTTYQFLSYKSGAIHHVTIGPLEPSTTYYYRCGKAGVEFSLRTPPATLPIEFIIIGQ